MNIVTVSPNGECYRLKPLAAALRNRGHKVVCLKNEHVKACGLPEVQLALVELMDVNWRDEHPFVRQLRDFKGRLFCTALDDGPLLFTHRLPQDLQDRVELIAKMQVWNDPLKYGEWQSKVWLVHPFINHVGVPPLPWSQKTDRWCWRGTNTGFVKDPGRRVRMCQVARDRLGERFIGGVCQRFEFYKDVVNVPPELVVKKLSRPDYLREINESRFSLCPKGNGAYTYRQSESHALGCCVIADVLEDQHIAFQHEAYEHYVPFHHALEALPVIPEELAEHIATEGKRHHDEFHAVDSGWLPTKKMLNHMLTPFEERLCKRT